MTIPYLGTFMPPLEFSPLDRWNIQEIVELVGCEGPDELGFPMGPAAEGPMAKCHGEGERAWNDPREAHRTDSERSAL